MLAEEHVDHLPVLIDGAVEIALLGSAEHKDFVDVRPPADPAPVRAGAEDEHADHDLP